MKLKLKNYLLIIFAMLLTIVFGLSYVFTIKNVKAQATEEIYKISDNKTKNSVKYLCYDLSGYEKINLLSLDNNDSCSQYCAKHGEDRKNGGVDLLSNGCRGYKLNGYNYGTNLIPYWINMAEVNKLANETQKNKFLSDVRTQTELWNGAYIYDGTNKIVNFYEIVSDSKPSNIGGKKVIEVLPYEFDNNLKRGYFNGIDTIQIAFKNGYYHYMYDTIVHEFGHVLGLGDLDANLSEIDAYKSGSHFNLMGYDRITAASEVYKAINYCDVQGVAVATGRHTCKDSDFKRYIKFGNEYRHICFYCDRIDNRGSIISGSYAMQSDTDCEHDYQRMVSCGVMHWKKCTKCYKILQTEGHSLYYHYLNKEKHEILCNDCNFYCESEAHTFVPYIVKSNSFNLNAIKSAKRCTKCLYILHDSGIEQIIHKNDEEEI